MWWHGDLATIHGNIASRYGMGKQMPLDAKHDLFNLIGAVSICIEKAVYRHERPCARICFDAAFETEHGLGILTDGYRVLGVGYLADVRPYRRSSTRSRITTQSTRAAKRRRK